MQRNLLVVTSGARDLLLREAESHGWALYVASRAREVDTLLNLRDFRVGIVRFDQSGARAHTEITDLVLANPAVRWIAVLEPSHLLQPEVSALVARAFHDYHTQPINVDNLLSDLGHAYGMASLHGPVPRTGVLGLDEGVQMMGASAPMQRLFRDIHRVSSIDAPVLIWGENGTGKELAARTLHQASPRSAGPFVSIECQALPPQLIQSTLFGCEHEGYAPQPASRGRLNAAAGGSIFLSDVHALPRDQQLKLLRYLQTNATAGEEAGVASARVLAATSLDLEQAVREGAFREDLYLRLSALSLKVAPLRERTGDAELLGRYFLERFSRSRRHVAKGLTPQAVQALERHDWPGNVRELMHRVQRAAVVCSRRQAGAADLGLERRSGQRLALSLSEARSEADRQAIEQSLRMNRNNVSQAARQLGISRVTLYRLLTQHGLGRSMV